ncbi:MAG: hypothetical protein ACOZNI_26600 [Myxococcota bacterium]
MEPLAPVDVLVLAGLLAVEPRESWTQAELAGLLRLSPAMITRSIQRLCDARLYDRGTRRVDRAAAAELLLHAVRLVFPARVGGPARGVPTAHSAPPLRDQLAADSAYVWPWEEGEVSGMAIEPLHPSVPAARASLPEAYELLALVDALRVGRARERALAAREIRSRLGVP